MSPVHLPLQGHPTRSLVMARRKGRYMSKAAEAFVEVMKKVLAEHSYQ